MRLSDHFFKISRNDPESEIAGHFNSLHHSGLNDVTMYVVDFVHVVPHTSKANTWEISWNSI